ncbi:MAG: Nif11-like leader peptide family RiPP precursor [Lachnospiraceae bacterium]|nr:Nif11-like leader peptide family RiPP precursor [Lachnospiraceae bacterium]
MNEETKKFLTALKENKDLETKMEEAVNRIFEEGKITSENDVYVAAAKELGYEITVEDLEKISPKVEELESDSLDEVAGGRRKFKPRKLYL